MSQCYRRIVVAAFVLLGGVTAAAQRYVPGRDAEHPRAKYADSLVSLNDRCVVRQSKLNLRVPPIYVNGSPIGFC